MSVDRQKSTVNDDDRILAISRDGRWGMAVSNTKVPRWSPEFQGRVGELIAMIGSQKNAAKIAGCTSEQLAKHRDGEAKMPFSAAIALCEATGRSLDWLAGVSGEHEVINDGHVAGAAREAAKYILGAAEFFDRPDPEELAEAIAKRTLYLLRHNDGGGAGMAAPLTREEGA